MEVLDGPVPVKDTENNSTLRIVFVFIITSQTQFDLFCVTTPAHHFWPFTKTKIEH